MEGPRSGFEPGSFVSGPPWDLGPAGLGPLPARKPGLWPLGARPLNLNNRGMRLSRPLALAALLAAPAAAGQFGMEKVSVPTGPEQLSLPLTLPSMSAGVSEVVPEKLKSA